MTYSWKWKNNKTVGAPMSVVTSKEKTKTTKFRNSMKKWGVHASTSLSLKDEFEHAKQKMKISIKI